MPLVIPTSKGEIQRIEEPRILIAETWLTPPLIALVVDRNPKSTLGIVDDDA